MRKLCPYGNVTNCLRWSGKCFSAGKNPQEWRLLWHGRKPANVLSFALSFSFNSMAAEILPLCRHRLLKMSHVHMTRNNQNHKKIPA